MKSRVVALAVCIAVSSLAATSRAQSEPMHEGPSLDARLAALDAYLGDVQRPTRAWWGSWLAALAALGVGQAVWAPFEDDRAARAGLIAGASFSFAGLGLLLARPVPGRYGARRLRAMPATTEAEKVTKVIAGEEWLEGDAEAARLTRAWWSHLIAVGLGAGALLGLGLGYDDNWWGAARSGIGVFVVTEARIWTRPMRSVDHWRRYRASPTVVPELGFMPLVAPRATGLVLGGRF